MMLRSLVAALFVGFITVASAFPSNTDRPDILGEHDLINNASMSLVRRYVDPPGAQTWNGRGTEVWIGRQAVTVGDIEPDAFFDAILQALDKLCPDGMNDARRDCRGDKESKGVVVATPKYVYDIMDGNDPDHKIIYYLGDSELRIFVDGVWEYDSEEMRVLLCKTIAVTLQSFITGTRWATSEDQFSDAAKDNCVMRMGFHFCNVGDHVLVNLPSRWNSNNHASITLKSIPINPGSGDTGVHSFSCCSDRRYVDKAVERYEDEFKDHFKVDTWDQDVRCIISDNGICEDCGVGICDSCGTTCKNVDCALFGKSWMCMQV